MRKEELQKTVTFLTVRNHGTVTKAAAVIDFSVSFVEQIFCAAVLGAVVEDATADLDGGKFFLI
jgi:hypothetical protein